jgi:hypothetical protein
VQPPALNTRAPEANAAAWLPADEQARVNRAIDRGVEYLQRNQQGNGSWPGFGNHVVGLAALPGLTLLECGVPPDNAQVQKAAQLVRRAVPEMNQTYELALAVLFLDRLGDPADRPLIRTLALRLLAGQGDGGGWSYTCPILPPQAERDLLTILRFGQPRSPLDGGPQGAGRKGPTGMTAPGEPGKSPEPAGPNGGGSIVPLSPPARDAQTPEPRPDEAAARKALDSLPRHLRRTPALHEPPQGPRQGPFADGGDNSNTQFATLGVWVAGRHGVPTERALAHIARRFRQSQFQDGTWGYVFFLHGPFGRPHGTPSMTGAGLLGLAVGLGVAQPDAREGKAPPRDPAVEKGLDALSHSISGSVINLYFLWTLERVGVLYNLRQIGGKDWYPWGARLLVEAQGPDGSWAQGGYPGSLPTTDTCFALLFLKRANLVRDLSKRLEFVIDTSKVEK